MGLAPLPRVTEILDAVGLGPELSRVPGPVLAAARRRGTAVHALIEAEAYGYLDPAWVTPEAAPYLGAYQKFVTESKHRPIASERLVTHPAWRYVGHVDRVGWLLGRRVLLDWKSGTSPDLVAASYQLAGYRLAWNAECPTEPVEAVAVVQFQPDGTYRVHEPEDIVHAEQVFLAAVVVYQARAERRR